MPTRLAVLRLGRKLTLDEAEEATGVDRSVIVAAERGESIPDQALKALAAHFEEPAERLLERLPPPEYPPNVRAFLDKVAEIVADRVVKELREQDREDDSGD